MVLVPDDVEVHLSVNWLAPEPPLEESMTAKQFRVPATESIQDLKAERAQEILYVLCERLDFLDCDDYFGTEGWRRFIMEQDE